MELHIAENLRLLRARRGDSLEAIAEIIGVSRQAVAKWESGETYPDIVNCLRLARLYKISLDELVAVRLQPTPEEGREKIMGMTRLSDTYGLTLPRSIITLFDLQAGENLLLLADKQQGIALVKCPPLEEGEPAAPARNIM